MSTSDPRPFPDDDQNPYAPPRSDLDAWPELIPAEVTPMPFSIGDVLSRTWEIYRDRMGSCIGVVFGCGALNFLANMGLRIAQAAAPQARNPEAFALAVAVLGTLGLLLFQAWINIGQALVMLDIARGREAVFGDVFSGGRFLLRAIVASLLFTLLILGPLAVGAIPGGLVWAAVGNQSAAGPIALALGVFAGFIAAIVLSLRFSQYYYLIVDRDAGTLDSLRISLQITRGNAGMLFVLGMFALAINLGGFLACLIGLIFTAPFTVLLFVVTYLALTGQPGADPYAKDETLADLEPL